MGLMDKVKAQASQLAQKTQETARDSMAKFDQAQANRRADAMLRDLGAVVYAERTGRGGPDTEAQVDALVAEISAHEAQHGISLAGQSAETSGPVAGGGPGFPGAAPQNPAAAPAGFPPDAPAGGFPPEPATGGFPPGPATGGFPPQSAPADFPAEAGAPADFPGSAPADFQGAAPGDFPGSAPADDPPESAETGFPPESRTPGSAEPGGTGFPPETGSGQG